MPSGKSPLEEAVSGRPGPSCRSFATPTHRLLKCSRIAILRRTLLLFPDALIPNFLFNSFLWITVHHLSVQRYIDQRENDRTRCAVVLATFTPALFNAPLAVVCILRVGEVTWV